MNKNKTILVTGATGLTGSGIIGFLLQNNYTILAISRKEQPVQHQNLNWIKFDILTDEIEKLFNGLPEIYCVIHAAAQVKQENKITSIERIRKTNIEFTDKLFMHFAMKDTAIPIIYISGLGFLQRPLDEVITEHHAVAPNTFYFLSKYWGELSLLEYAKISKLRPIIFRVSSPVSNDVNLLHNTVVRKWINLGKSGKAITIDGTGKRRQDFVSTSDIAQAALMAIENSNVSGIFNITSGTSLSMKELATIIAKYFNVEIEFNNVNNEVDDSWNVSIKKANESFGYTPHFSAAATINNLLIYSFEDSHYK